MADLEAALNQSFADAVNIFSNREISTSENTNVLEIFEGINNITDCIICCDDEINCIKCFQCTAMYCKDCLTKIASEFNKCSTCSIEIKCNFNKFKDYNKELQKKKRFR